MKIKFTKIIRSPLAWFFIILGAVALMTALGPEEKTLGRYVRVVYLHGAWVWVSLIMFILAAVSGLAAFIIRQKRLHRWSRALGRTGLFFWITYLPISLWAMQTNWNGLFLAEPRWRLAMTFVIVGLLLQIGATLLENPAWASITNLLFVMALFITLNMTPNVMHPPSPIYDSNAARIQIYFTLLVSLIFLAACQVARWWHGFASAAPKPAPR